MTPTIRYRFMKIREKPASPAELAFARNVVAEQLGDLSRTATAEVAEREGRLRRTEERIAGLVRFISEGDTSKAPKRKTMMRTRIRKTAFASSKSRKAPPRNNKRPKKQVGTKKVTKAARKATERFRPTDLNRKILQLVRDHDRLQQLLRLEKARRGLDAGDFCFSGCAMWLRRLGVRCRPF